MAGGSNRRQLWPQLIVNYVKASLCKSPLDTTFCLKSKNECCDCFWILSISWKLLIMGIKVIWLKNKLWSAFWFQKQNYKNVVSTSQPNKQNNAHQENWEVPKKQEILWDKSQTLWNLCTLSFLFFWKIVCEVQLLFWSLP